MVAAVTVTLLVVLSVSVGPAAATIAAQETSLESSDTVPTRDPSTVSIGQNLQNESGTVQVVVRLVAAGRDDRLVGSDAAVKRALKDHAVRTQRPLKRFAAERRAVTVLKEFWLMNAVLLEVDTDRVPLVAIHRVKHVESLHENAEVQVIDGNRAQFSGTAAASATTGVTSSAGYNTTYGLDQVNATEVWDAYGTQGDGVKVAVLDTGVNQSHPDIDLYTNNSSDPTYPGGWAEFNDTGGRVEGSTPHDTHGHGTHTTGTVGGDNASGQWIGVAPDAELMHALVTPQGHSTVSQIVAGMEWAVDNDADVLSISLGLPDNLDWKEPVENTQAAGTLVVVAAGNDGEGFTDSPGNMFESVTVGASDSSYDIARFSGGEVVNASTFKPHRYPEDWPTSFVVPDVAAPGVHVNSSLMNGSYEKWNGTSMATPHVAGTFALMIAAGRPNTTVGNLKSALYATAWKPAGEPTGNDTRYGAGLVDAKAATDRVALDSGINGTVANASGDVVSGAKVETDIGDTRWNYSVRTDPSGRYSLLARNGTTAVTADGFGYAAKTHTVTVPNGGFATLNFTLAAKLEGVQTTLAPEVLDSSNAQSVTFRFANADNVTVTLEGDYEQRQAELRMNGMRQSFGTPVDLSGRTSNVTVTVDPEPFTAGNFSMNVTIRGEGSTRHLTTDTTRVFDRVTDVAVLDTSTRPGCFGACLFGEDVGKTLQQRLPENYTVTNETNKTVLDNLGQYDIVVVQRFPNNDDQFVREFVNRTSTADIGVVYLEQYEDDSNAISELAADTGMVDSTGGTDEGDERLYIRESHPVFYRVGTAGNTINLHDSFFGGQRAWFSGFEGKVIAEVGNTSAVDGDAVAVNDTHNTLLAASFGYSFATWDKFTKDANQTLENAVRYVDPPPETGCRDISSSGVYTLENDTYNAHDGRIDGDVCIYISSSDIVLDGKGHIIDGVDDGFTTGILVNGTGRLSNVTVRNITVADWYEGLKVNDTSSVDVTGVRALDNEFGIAVYNSEDAQVTRSLAASNTEDGIVAFESPDTTVTNSTARDNQIGVNVLSSNRTTVSDTVTRNNSYTGVATLATANGSVTNVTSRRNGYGFVISLSLNTTVTNSIADGNDKVAPVEVNLSRTAGAIVVNSFDTTVLNTSFDDNDGVGVIVHNATDTHLARVTAVEDANWSVYLSNGSTGTVVDNLRLSPNTTVSFRGRDVAIDQVSSRPALPEGGSDVDVYVNATNTSTGGWLNLTASYDEDDASDLNESALEYWRHDGTWSAIENETVTDPAANEVRVNVTPSGGPAVYAPLVVGIANVDAGPDRSASEGEVVTVNASVSGSVTNATIDWGDGTVESGTITDGNVTGSHTYADNETYTVNVTASDGTRNASDTFNATITNVAPVVNANDTSGPEGSEVTLNASFSDAGTNDTHTATIDWGDGTVESGAVSGGTLKGSHTYADNGSYPVTVTVTDDDGGVGTDTGTATITNVAPVVNANDTSGPEGSEVTLNASFQDGGTNDTHNATIDWGDGTIEPATISDGSITGSHTYADIGSYTVIVTVTDDDGGVGFDTATAKISNVAPMVTLNESAAIDDFNGSKAFTGRVGDAQTHTATASDPGDDNLTFRWNFGTGDGFTEGDTYEDTSSAIGTQATDAENVTYDGAGVYIVVVRVTDGDGGSDEDSLPKVVTGNATKTRGQGFWKHQAGQRGKTTYTEAEMEAFLDVTSFASSHFDNLTISEAEEIFETKGPGLRQKTTAAALAAWLNYASGSVGLTETIEIDFDEDGVIDERRDFEPLMDDVDTTLNDGSANQTELERAKDLAEAVNEDESSE